MQRVLMMNKLMSQKNAAPKQYAADKYEKTLLKQQLDAAFGPPLGGLKHPTKEQEQSINRAFVHSIQKLLEKLPD
jgi:hypothetical protein